MFIVSLGQSLLVFLLNTYESSGQIIETVSIFDSQDPGTLEPIAWSTLTENSEIVSSKRNYESDNLNTLILSSEPSIFILHPQSSYQLVPSQTDNTTKFMIFEAHSQRDCITLAPTSSSRVFVNSTSPALFKTIGDLNDSAAILHNPWKKNVTAIVFVRLYTSSSPVPGQCNTHPGVLVKPYLNLSWKKPLVYLNFSQASLPALSCANIGELVYQVYQFYLPENDCSFNYFLSGYKQFNSLQDILKSGSLIAQLSHHNTKLTLANYPRTGRILAVIVSYENSSALYGLAHVYGANFSQDGDDGCEVHDSTFMFVSCALGVFVGLFLAFMGHRFFKCSQFLFGFYLGSFAGIIIMSRCFELEAEYLYTLTAVCGTLMGTLVLLLWVFLGIPVLAVLIPTLETGFILAAVLMYLPLCTVEAFSINSTYWLVFVCILFCPTLFFIAFTQKASIISNVALGAITFIVCIDHYTDSNLKYTFKNVFNRLIYTEFGEAAKCPPFQRSDLLLVTCLLGVMVLGLVCQLILERKKAPFPPAPFQQWRWARTYASEQEEEERTPLMSGEVVGTTESPSAPLPPVVGYISGHTGGHASSGPGANITSNASRPKRRQRSSAQSFGAGVGNGSYPVRDIFTPPPTNTPAM